MFVVLVLFNWKFFRRLLEIWKKVWCDVSVIGKYEGWTDKGFCRNPSQISIYQMIIKFSKLNALWVQSIRPYLIQNHFKTFQLSIKLLAYQISIKNQQVENWREIWKIKFFSVWSPPHTNEKKIGNWGIWNED